MKMKPRGPLRDGAIYDKYYPKPPGETITIKKGAKLTDTLEMLPEYVKKYAFQADMIAPVMRDIDGDVFKTCYNLWSHFHYDFGYQADPDGVETIQSLSHLWWSPGKKGDCDCLSFGLACNLYTLKINFLFKVTQNDDKGGFGHIYIVVPYNGKQIIIDPCMNSFNREAPYINKIEVNMDLQFLDGIDPEMFSRNGGMSVDAEDLLSCQLPKPNPDGSMGSLKTFINKAKDKIQNTTQNIKTGIHNTEQNVKADVKKTGKVISQGIHVINRVNPATTALRLGLLAGMKLNLFGVSGQLRYAYLSDADAQKRGINMKRFDHLKKVRTKLEKIFFNAGGKPENLKESILSGKGNQDKGVALSGYALSGLGYTGGSSVQQIIGDEMYADEIPQESLNGLGVVATAAVTAAASGILVAIAGILKNIGPLFQKGEPGADKGLDELDKQAGDASATDDMVTNTSADESAPTDNGSTDRQTSDSTTADSTTTDSTTADSTTSNDTTTDSNAPKDDSSGNGTFWENAQAWIVKNKTPLIITGVSVGVVIAGAILYRKYSKGKKEKSNRGSRAESMNGISKKSQADKETVGKISNGKEKILRDLRLSRMK